MAVRFRPCRRPCFASSSRKTIVSPIRVATDLCVWIALLAMPNGILLMEKWKSNMPAVVKLDANRNTPKLAATDQQVDAPSNISGPRDEMVIVSVLCSL